MSTERTLPKHIEVDRKGKNKFSIKIDGVELGFYITDISTAASPGTLPSITITIPTEQVTYRDAVG